MRPVGALLHNWNAVADRRDGAHCLMRQFSWKSTTTLPALIACISANCFVWAVTKLARERRDAFLTSRRMISIIRLLLFYYHSHRWPFHNRIHNHSHRVWGLCQNPIPLWAVDKDKWIKTTRQHSCNGTGENTTKCLTEPPPHQCSLLGFWILTHLSFLGLLEPFECDCNPYLYIFWNLIA